MVEAVAAVCPKCGTPRDDKPHCSKCGLAAAKMADFAKTRDDVPDALANAWSAAVEQWADAKRHDEVLRLVTQHDAYAWAAARYREHIRDKPGDPVATEQLDRVKRAAEATLMSSAAARKSKEPEPYRATMAMLGLLIILIIAGLVYVVARGSGDPAPPTRRLPPAETK